MTVDQDGQTYDAEAENLDAKTEADRFPFASEVGGGSKTALSTPPDRRVSRHEEDGFS